MTIWTQTDLNAWRALLAEAEACAAVPSRPTTALAKCVKLANKAVIPTRCEVGRADCYRLFNFALTFTALDGQGRADNAEMLAKHVAVARLAVDPPAKGEAQPVARLRPRRDIDDIED